MVRYCVRMILKNPSVRMPAATMLALASKWKPSLRPFNKFTEASSPRVQPTCSFPLPLTFPRSLMAAKWQCEQACRDKCKCSRHAVRDEVPTILQSLVAVEPESSLHAEASPTKWPLQDLARN